MNMSDKPLIYRKKVPIKDKEIEEFVEIFNTNWEDFTEEEIEKIKNKAKSFVGKGDPLNFTILFDRLMILQSIAKNYQKMKTVAEIIGNFYDKIFKQIDDELAKELGEWLEQVTEKIRTKYIT